MIGCRSWNDVKQKKEHYKSPLLFYVKNGFAKIGDLVWKYSQNKYKYTNKDIKNKTKSENSFLGFAIKQTKTPITLKWIFQIKHFLL
jgi:hypothetical protein